MPASSLIFVVIVAIWAAYLLQHWSRRREDAAAARSVDGFTEAMRVLEKRRVLPETDLAEPRPHSYSVTPARVVRSTVDVKRAVPASASRRSPLVARRRSADRPEEQPRVARAQIDRNGSDPEVEPMSAVPARPDCGAARPVSLGQRRLRAALLLASLIWVPVSVVLAVTGVLLWISVPFSALTVVAVLVWLRTEARADRARSAASRQAPRRTVPAQAPVLSSDDTQVIRQPQRYAAAEPAAEPAAASSVAEPASSVAEPAPSHAGMAAHASSAAYDTVFDLEAAEPAPPATSEPPAPGTWSPVPVPTPTYAMKAKAEPRYTADGIPADVFDTPEFADEADELDDRALFARRAVSQ